MRLVGYLKKKPSHYIEVFQDLDRYIYIFGMPDSFVSCCICRSSHFSSFHHSINNSVKNSNYEIPNYSIQFIFVCFLDRAFFNNEDKNKPTKCTN